VKLSGRLLRKTGAQSTQTHQRQNDLMQLPGSVGTNWLESANRVSSRVLINKPFHYFKVSPENSQLDVRFAAMHSSLHNHRDIKANQQRLLCQRETFKLNPTAAFV
jgi:hypothetical protein